MREPVIVFWMAFLSWASISAQDSQEEVRQLLLAERISLPRLLDLCATHLEVNIDYDPNVVKGEASLRLGAGMGDESLWSPTNRVLAARGLVSVQLPGEELLSIVPIEKAASLARLEESLDEALAGFVSTIIAVPATKPTRLVESLTPLLSKPGGRLLIIEESGDEAKLLLSDLKPRAEEIFSVLQDLQAVPGVEAVEELILRAQPAAEVVTLIEQVTAAHQSMYGDTRLGKVLATGDGRRVLIISPPGEFSYWKALVEKFDKADFRETVAYTPKTFSADQVAILVERVLENLSGPGESNWSLVEDELTGSLLLTGTARHHEEVASLLARLDASDDRSRQGVQQFQLRNRGVKDVFGLLSELLSAGVAEVFSEDVLEPSEAEGPSRLRAESREGELGAEQPVEESSKARGPGFSLSADEGTNTLIAVADPFVLRQLEKLIEAIDVRQSQVMIEATVVSVSESQALDVGVELQRLGISNETLSSLTSLFGLGSPELDATSLDAGNSPGFSAVLLNQGDYSAVLRALEAITEGQTLTRPSVLVNNNEQAQLDSVLQSPFLSTNASDTVATTSFGGTQDAGTLISVTPQIAEGDHIILEYDITLSSFVGDSVDPSLPPPRQQNKIRSVATVPDGYTVVVGGLKVDSLTESESKVPILGDIPLLGRLFKSTSKTRSESKLFVFIRSVVMRDAEFEALKFWSRAEREAASLEPDAPEVVPVWMSDE